MATRKPRSKAPKEAKPAAVARAKPDKTPARKSMLYLGRDEYKATIDALVAQGLEREDAVLTLRVGIRQANGRPVPAELLAQCVNDPFAASDEAELAKAA